MRLPLRCLSLAAALLALALPVTAEESWGFDAPDTAALQAMLDRLPAILVAPGTGRGTIGFGDLAAARALIGPDPAGPRPAAVQALARALPPGPVAEAAAFGPDDWRAAVGFGPDDVQRLILFDAPPLAAGVWELAPEAAAAVPAALRAQGYAETERDGDVVLAVGEDGQMDLAARRPGDPFRGALGRSSRVSLEGPILRHASVWPLLAAVEGAAGAPAGQEPGLAAMVGLLDGLGCGTLLRADLVPDASGIGAGDPLAAVTGGAAGGSAVAWGAMLLADFSTGPESSAVLVLSLPWPEAVPVEPLAQAVAVLWQTRASASGGSFAERLGVPAEVTARRGPGGLALLRLVVTVPTTESPGGLPVNRAFDTLAAAHARRDMVFLP